MLELPERDIDAPDERGVLALAQGEVVGTKCEVGGGVVLPASRPTAGVCLDHVGLNPPVLAVGNERHKRPAQQLSALHVSLSALLTDMQADIGQRLADAMLAVREGSTEA